jgi:hypothetical protein
VYGMLNPSSEVTAIEVKRAFAHQPDTVAFLPSWWEIPFITIGVFVNKVFRRVPTARVFEVNTAFVEQQKKMYIEEKKSAATKDNANVKFVKPSFLSTNDILTQWFFKFTGLSMGFMIVNFRNRIAGLSSSLGGNYQGRVLFLPEDMTRPEYVRMSLEKFRPVVSHNKGSTRSVPQLLDMNVGLVTNWASFYSEVAFPGCQQALHLPVIDLRSGTPLRHCMVIFQATKTKTAVVLWNSHNVTLPALQQQEILQAMS